MGDASARLTVGSGVVTGRARPDPPGKERVSFFFLLLPKRGPKAARVMVAEETTIWLLFCSVSYWDSKIIR